MIDGKVVGQFLQTALGHLTVKNALYQLSWLCITMTPICFFSAWAFRAYDHDIVVWLLRLGALPLLITLGLAVVFGFSNPSLLQSEEFQTREHSLQLLQGRRRHEVIDADAVVAIANPALRPELPAAPVNVQQNEAAQEPAPVLAREVPPAEGNQE